MDVLRCIQEMLSNIRKQTLNSTILPQKDLNTAKTIWTGDMVHEQPMGELMRYVPWTGFVLLVRERLVIR